MNSFELKAQDLAIRIRNVQIENPHSANNSFGMYSTGQHRPKLFRPQPPTLLHFIPPKSREGQVAAHYRRSVPMRQVAQGQPCTSRAL